MLENHAYEQALLGAILLDNRVLEDYSISAKLFDMEVNRKVFRAIETVRGSGGVADILTVATTLPEACTYVAQLTNTPSAANVKFYIDELSELARKRGLAKLSREVAEIVNDAESSDIFAHIDRALIDIADTKDTGYRLSSEYLVTTIAEIKKAFELKGALSGIATGFPRLDEITNGWQPGELIIIGARPGAGKTSIALNMASAAIRSDHIPGFFSAEMSGESILKRVIADWGCVEFKRLRTGLMGQHDFTSIIDAGQKIAGNKFFINDKPAIKLDELVRDARAMYRKDKVDIFFIDYLSLIDNKSKGIPRHEQVAEISMTLKKLARELNVPVVALSQLTREAQGERPKLSQLRDSGAVEQDADMVILLWNQGYVDDLKREVKITLIVEKGRNTSIGDIPMVFRPGYMRFAEVAEAWEQERKRD